jgi:hypothetical protein
MMRVALVSTEQFEVAGERDQFASANQLAEMSTKKNEQPREWWFVRCILDGQPAIPLAYEGRSRFHTFERPAESGGEMALQAAASNLYLGKPNSPPDRYRTPRTLRRGRAVHARTTREHFPPIFPQFLGEIRGPFTPKAGGKGSGPSPKY